MNRLAAIRPALARPGAGSSWRIWGHAAGLAGLAIILIAFLSYQTRHLGGFQWDTDEGINLMKAWMVQLGYPLYTQVWADQPPGYTVLLAMAFNLVGTSVETARLLTVIHACLALVAVTWLVRELGGRWLGALAAAAILAVTPNFFWTSRAAMIGLPALSLAALAMASGFAYLRTGRRIWLVAAGLVFGLSLLEKLVGAYMAVPLAMLAALRTPPGEWRTAWRQVVADVFLVGACAALPLLLTLIVFDGRAMIDQILGTFLDARDSHPLKVYDNWSKLRRYFTVDNYGLVALAAYGLLELLATRSRRALVFFTWLGLTIAFLLFQTPLWPKHHFLPLLLQVTVLCGLAVSYLLDRLTSLGRQSPAGFAWLVVGLSTLVLLFHGLNWMLLVDQHLPTAQSYETKRLRVLPADKSYLSAENAIRFVQTATAPGDFIVTDYPMIAFRARRHVPPTLIVPSGKRVRSGRLMSDELIDITRHYQAAAVILWDEKLASFSEYVDWLQAEYRHVAQMGDDHDVYVPRRIDPAITFPARARFGDAIDLLGYSFDAPIARPEAEFPVRLYWQAVDVPAAAYGYNLRLMRDGREWWRWDTRPQAAMRETTEWSAGEVVPDALPIDIQPATPPGTYQLELRVYDSETGAGLPIHQPDKPVLPGEWLLLGPLEVGP